MTDGEGASGSFACPRGIFTKYEDVNFTLRDERTGGPLRIVGWWIPHPQADGRCVVLLHGLADAKVGVIAWAPLWHSLGFNILAIDLRAHGERRHRIARRLLGTP